MSEPTLTETIKAAMKAAMKARDKDRLGTIRLIQAEFKRIEVDERFANTSEINFITSHTNRSLQQFVVPANRSDLIHDSSLNRRSRQSSIRTDLGTPLLAGSALVVAVLLATSRRVRRADRTTAARTMK